MEKTGNIYIIEAEENFKRVHKSIIESENIDCETLGIYTRIIVLGLKWNLNIKGLSTHLKLSDARIRKAINSLEKEGYIVRTAVKQESGKFAGWNYKVFPYPVNEELRSSAGKPTCQKTDTPQNGQDRLRTTPSTDMSENGVDNNNILKEDIDLNNNKTKEKEISTKVDTKKEKTNFDKFNDWLKENTPNVLKLSTQMTEEQFNKLRAKYEFEQMSYILLQMENYKGLAKKYTSVYLTFNNWAKREYGTK